MTQFSLVRGGLLLGGVVLLGVGCPWQQPTPVAEPIIEVEPVESPLPVELPPVASAPVADTEPAEVMITASGFSPAAITIPVGTTVVFRNSDTKPHWAASDPHPVHTGLPGFDAGKAIPKDGTYSYTFTKTGTFTYHDHLNQSLTGTIVVQ